MAGPYWILDRNHPPSVLRNGVLHVVLTDGRKSRDVVLQRSAAAKAFLEANAYAEGPDALFVSLVQYWASERRNGMPGWVPANEEIDLEDIERFHALFEQDRKAHLPSPYPSWT